MTKHGKRELKRRCIISAFNAILSNPERDYSPLDLTKEAAGFGMALYWEIDAMEFKEDNPPNTKDRVLVQKEDTDENID